MKEELDYEEITENILQSKPLFAGEVLDRKIENLIQMAIERRFGEYSEENRKKCKKEQFGSSFQIKHDDVIICEFYPPEQPSFPGSSATNGVQMHFKFRIIKDPNS